MLFEIVDNKGKFYRRVKCVREGVCRCIIVGGRLFGNGKVDSKELE